MRFCQDDVASDACTCTSCRREWPEPEADMAPVSLVYTGALRPKPVSVEAAISHSLVETFSRKLNAIYAPDAVIPPDILDAIAKADELLRPFNSDRPMAKDKP